ncbi:MAG: hypothetical protein NW202_12800 [Nitrospira sp.]|nr:hypothetical protein [Nitrospira sp.]
MEAVDDWDVAGMGLDVVSLGLLQVVVLAHMALPGVGCSHPGPSS